MQELSRNAWKNRALLKDHIRSYFAEQGLLEVDSPVLNPTPTVEAHLDSFVVGRSGVRKSPHAPESHRKTSRENKKKSAESDLRASIAPHGPAGDVAGYLITSPEYNLKKIVARHKTSVYEIAHCFREGDLGPWHSEEFLMLEWYLVGASLDTLMDFSESFLESCTDLPFACRTKAKARRIRIDDLFLEHTGSLPLESNLDSLIQRHGLSSASAENLPFDDKFFLVFLNLLEPHIREGLYFLYDYPAPLAALSKIQDGHARRFEIYWQGIELANGYEELQSAQEYQAAFARENYYRKNINKNEVSIDHAFLELLEKTGGLPPCSGIALGFERLLALLSGDSSLIHLSPFAFSL